METLLSEFERTGDQLIANSILQYCIDNSLYHIGINLGKKFSSLFPLNIILKESLSNLYLLTNDYITCYTTLQTILENSNIDFSIAENLLSKQKIAIEKIQDNYISYPKEKVAYLTSKPKSTTPVVTVSITTCKRYDLFHKTINSFLNCCTDIDLVDEWICVDDNSSEEDRAKMKELYPFFTFYFKTKEEKGHPKSMNIIRELVQTPYLFHMEDDWKFFCKTNFISRCLDVLSCDNRIGQCLLNRNYMETERDSGRIVGGFPNKSLTGLRYYIHEFCPDKKSSEEFNRKYNFQPNCAYWAHFSFRPSMIRTFILKDLGEFSYTDRHFEMEYSYRYIKRGYISAFLESIYCIHTGRLTSELDSDKLNAYILNDEQQFGTKKTVSSPSVLTFIVNLDRRPDRMERLLSSPTFPNFKYIRFPAIDGKKLQPTEQLQRLCDGNDYNMQEGMIGCMLSHIVLYTEILRLPQSIFCILEDDVEFLPEYNKKLTHILNNLPSNWDLIYLGHHIYPTYITEKTFSDELPTLERWDTVCSLTKSAGGTIGYLISKQGALNMLRYINQMGMTNCIDTIQQKSADYLNIYYSLPHLIKSECFTINRNVDTDIQAMSRSLTIPLETRLEKQIKEWRKYATKNNINLYTTTDRDVMLKYVCTEGEKDIMVYNGDFIRDLMAVCKYPCYTLEYKVLIVVPNYQEEFQRLFRNGVCDITGLFKDNLKFISLSGTTHVSDIIPSNSYPFDKIEGGSTEIFVSILETILTGGDRDFTKKFCDLQKNKVEFLQFANKNILRNTEYNISFPHEDLGKLEEIYYQKFSRLYYDCTNPENTIVFICCTRTEKIKEECLNKLLTLVPTCKILVINGIESTNNDRIIVEKIPYLHTENDWTYEKTKYDQEVFKNQLEVVIKKFIEKNIMDK